MKKRILIIAPSPLYLEKGSSLRMYSILEKLSKKFKIDLITYSLGRDFKLKNVNVYRTPIWYKPELSIGKPSFSKIFLDVFMLIKAIKLSIKNNYDIIHCEDFEGLTIGYLIKKLNQNSIYIYDLHNRILDNLHLKMKPNKIIDNFILSLEKKMVAVTNKIILNWGKYLKDSFFANKSKFLYYDPIDKSQSKVNLPIKNYLIYAGNFEEYQGLSDFIPVFLKVKTNLNLVLIGEPKQDIIDLIKENKAEKRIFVLGRMSISKTNYLIKNSIAGILPRREGSCMKAIHYFICKKPVISKDTLSNRELVKDNYNGFLYETEEQLKNILENKINKKILNKLNKGILETQKKVFNIWDDKRFLREYGE